MNKYFSSKASSLLPSIEKGFFYWVTVIFWVHYQFLQHHYQHTESPERSWSCFHVLCWYNQSTWSYTSWQKMRPELRKIFEQAENMAEFIFEVKLEVVPRQTKLQKDEITHHTVHLKNTSEDLTLFSPLIICWLSTWKIGLTKIFFQSLRHSYIKKCLPQNAETLNKLNSSNDDKVSNSTFKSEYLLNVRSTH